MLYCAGFTSILNISIGSVGTIILDQLHYRKVCASWIPQMLTDQQKQTRLQIAHTLLAQYEEEGEEFLQSIITMDEIWVHYFMPETKRMSMQWHHAHPRSQRKRRPPFQWARSWLRFLGRLYAGCFAFRFAQRTADGECGVLLKSPGRPIENRHP